VNRMQLQLVQLRWFRMPSCADLLQPHEHSSFLVCSRALRIASSASVCRLAFGLGLLMSLL